jgi:hypothetical protein
LFPDFPHLQRVSRFLTVNGFADELVSAGFDVKEQKECFFVPDESELEQCFEMGRKFESDTVREIIPAGSRFLLLPLSGNRYLKDTYHRILPLRLQLRCSDWKSRAPATQLIPGTPFREKDPSDAGKPAEVW